MQRWCAAITSGRRSGSRKALRSVGKPETGGRAVWLLVGLTNLALEHREDYRRAKELFEEAITLSRELGDALTLGNFLNGLGYVIFSKANINERRR